MKTVDELLSQIKVDDLEKPSKVLGSIVGGVLTDCFEENKEMEERGKRIRKENEKLFGCFNKS